MDRIITFLLCFVLVCQPVLAVDFTQDAVKEALETEEALGDQTQEGWDAAFAPTPPLFEEEWISEPSDEEAVGEVFEEAFEEALGEAFGGIIGEEANGNDTKEIFFADTAEENEFSDSLVGAEIIESGTCGEKATWTLDREGTMTIRGTGAMEDYEFSYDHPWDDHNEAIKNLIIEYGITHIGENAFSYCYELKSVTIPESVTSIGGNAFSSCDRLNDVAIPNSVTTIGESAFTCCQRLANVTIPNSVTTIGERAFYLCPSLMRIKIPSSVTEIGKCAFSACENLITIFVEDENPKYKSIHGVLYDKPVHNVLTWPSGKRNINFPDSVTGIGNYAFYVFHRMTDLTIPNSITSIGEHAFESCYTLTSVTIPSSVTSIDKTAFCECNKLIRFFVEDENPNYKSINGVLYDKSGSTLIKCPDCKSEITIADSVTRIGDYAVSNCDKLKDVTIPDSVTSIGEYSFSGCRKLKNVTIPNSVTSIGPYSFSWCNRLKNVILPDSVISIGEYAFTYCSALTSVTLSNSLQRIGSFAFNSCNQLKSVTLGNALTYIGESALYDTPLTSLVIPESVTYIGDYAIGFMFDDEAGEDHKKVPGFTIYGVPASTAESYAIKYAFDFKPIDPVTLTPSPTSTPSPSPSPSASPSPSPSPSITFPSSNETAYLGYTLKLEPEIKYSSSAVKFKSSKTSVATVDSSGLVPEWMGRNYQGFPTSPHPGG